MAATPLCLDACSDVVDLLKEGEQVKYYAGEATKRYATGPNSPLDGSLHPSLRSETTELVLMDSRGETLSQSNTAAQTISRRSTAVVKSNDEVKKQEDAFKEAMRQYEREAKKKYRTGMDPDKTHTITQLESAIAKSIEKHDDEEAKGYWGRINIAFRKLGGKKEDINGWLGLLPSESQYFSVICGGFKLIIEAAARLSKVHGEVLDALERIPGIIDSAQRVLRIYNDSERLECLSKSFYMSILSALGHIMHYLQEKASSRIKVFLMPSGFKEQLIKNIDAIAKDKDAFNEEANICQKEMLERVENQGEQTGDDIRRMEQTLNAATVGQSRANLSLAEKVEMIRRQNSDLGRDMKRDMKELKTAMTQPFPVARLMEVLAGNDKLLAYSISMLRQLDSPGHASEEDSRRQTSSSSSKKKKTGKSYIPLMGKNLRNTLGNSTNSSAGETTSQRRRRLLSMLDYDQDAAGADVVSLYALGPTLSRDDQERSIYVIKSGKLAKWVAAERSTVLFVNGNARGLQRRSAQSFVCARLSFSLEQIRAPGGSTIERPDVVPLYFFCGQHASGDQSWETPAGVLNSLLAQLLTQCRDLDLTKTVKLGKFDNEDVQEVFHYFESAIAKVSADTTVLCVIDGLSFYLDDSEVSDEAERLVQRLMRLVRAKSRKRPCTFKLLLTASNRLHASEVEDMGEDEILNVPSVLPFTGGFTAMKWNLGVGQQLESLAESE